MADIDPQTAAARDQVRLLQSERKQIGERQAKDAARIVVIDTLLTSLQALANAAPAPVSK